MLRGLARFAALGVAVAGLPSLPQADPLVRVNLEGRVREVPLETYVASATASEIYSSWPIEALRAQAVVARTYALYEKGRRAEGRFDLDASVLSQRYQAAALFRQHF